MIELTEAPTNDVSARPRGGTALRFALLGRAAVIGSTAVLAAGLFAIWTTFAALAPLTFCAPLLIPVTALTRACVDAHRGTTATLLTNRLPRPYRDTTGQPLLRRTLTILRDPASRRDALWLFLHSIVGTVCAWLQLGLFAGGLLYLTYPFLFWVTPHKVFGRPFGGLIHLHTVGQAAAMMPLAMVAFALWYALAVPLSRADAGLTRRLLR